MLSILCREVVRSNPATATVVSIYTFTCCGVVLVGECLHACTGLIENFAVGLGKLGCVVMAVVVIVVIVGMEMLL